MSITADSERARCKGYFRGLHSKHLLEARLSNSKRKPVQSAGIKQTHRQKTRIRNTPAQSPPLFDRAIDQNLHGVLRHSTHMRPSRIQRNITCCTAGTAQSHHSPRKSSMGAPHRNPNSRQAPVNLAQPANTSRNILPCLHADPTLFSMRTGGKAEERATCGVTWSRAHGRGGVTGTGREAELARGLSTRLTAEWYASPYIVGL